MKINVCVQYALHASCEPNHFANKGCAVLFQAVFRVVLRSSARG